MRTLHHTQVVLILFFLLFLSCKKNPVPDPTINFSMQDINNGFRFNASIANIATEDLLESGFVWGESENPSKGAAFTYILTSPSKAFNYDAVAGFSKDKKYYARAYYIDIEHQLHYSNPVSFDGKNTLGLSITLVQQVCTWGDEVEIKVANANANDLAASGIIINETLRVIPSKITAESVFFKVPFELYKYQNSVSLELYKQAGRRSYFILKQPALASNLSITEKLGATLKLPGNYFNPSRDSNIVMIGTTRIEVLKVAPNEIEIKLPVTDFAYNGNLSIQTGSGLKFTSTAISKVYKHLTPIGEFPGVARFGGMMETMNGKIYCGFGADINSQGLNDFYEYNPASSAWKRMPDFPFVLYGGAQSFTIKNKLFIIPNALENRFNSDVYQFDLETDRWSKVSAYIDTRLLHYTVFASDKYGYMLGGQWSNANNYVFTVNAFKRYDPSTDTWKRMPNFPGTSRSELRSLKVGNNVIIFGGASMVGDGKTVYPTDCWEFNLSTETWKQIKNFPAYINAYNAFAFELNGKAYIGGGSNNGSISSSIYEYDPITETFNKKDNIIDNAMLLLSSAASINGKGYVIFGKSRFDNHVPPLKEIFRFDL